MVFEFWDGTTFRRCDPWRAYRAIEDHKLFNLDRLQDAIELIEPETTYFVEAICEAFGVQEFDEKTGRGLTRGEMYELFDSLVGFFFALKKNGRTSSTSAEAGETIGSSVGDSAIPNSPNSPSQACTALAATNCDAAPQSPLPSAMPPTDL